MTRLVHHDEWLDPREPVSVYRVFVPGALAGGVIVSLGLMLVDVVQRIRGTVAADRRRILTARSLVSETVHGEHGSVCDRYGLRRDAVYGLSAGLSLGLAAYLVPGATWNFFKPRGYLSDIGWIWAISLVAVAVFATLGIRLLRAAPQWGIVVAAAVSLVATGRATWLAARGWDIGVFIIGLAVTGAMTWYAANRAVDRSIPPATRALLLRTPLTKVPASGSRG